MRKIWMLLPLSFIWLQTTQLHSAHQEATEEKETPAEREERLLRALVKESDEPVDQDENPSAVGPIPAEAKAEGLKREKILLKNPLSPFMKKEVEQKRIL